MVFPSHGSVRFPSQIHPCPQLSLSIEIQRKLKLSQLLDFIGVYIQLGVKTEYEHHSGIV
jgi:hypothetical protein